MVFARSVYAFENALSFTKVALTALPIGVQGTRTQMRLSRYVTCAGKATTLVCTPHVRYYREIHTCLSCG